MKKMFVLIRKDIRDAVTEKTSLLMASVPIVFSILFKYIVFAVGKEILWYILYSCSFYNIALMPMCVFPLLVTQEKEKQTLPVLLRSGVSRREMLGAKAAAATGIELFSAAVIALVCELNLWQLVSYLALNVLISVCLLPIGGIVGIFAVDKNSTNVYSTFGVLFMMLTPLFSIARIDVLGDVCRLLPSALFSEVYFPWIHTGELSWQQLTVSGGITVVWFIAGWFIYLYLLKKYGLRMERKEVR